MQRPESAHSSAAACWQDGSMKQEAEEAAPKMPAKPTLLLRGRREPGGVNGPAVFPIVGTRVTVLHT